eukprot:g715.t1
MERSDVIIQVIDARNPMLYYCPDLIEYANTIDPLKKTLLVLNKADYLTAELRLRWAKKLHSLGLSFVFFSAKEEQEKLDAAAEAEKNAESNAEKAIQESLTKLAVAEAQGLNIEEVETDTESKTETPSLADDSLTSSTSSIGEENNEMIEMSRVLTREDFMIKVHEMKQLRLQAAANAMAKEMEDPTLRTIENAVKKATEMLPPLPKRYMQDGRIDKKQMAKDRAVFEKQRRLDPVLRDITIGTVGFPNVGKSSLINVLMSVTAGSHGLRVAVGSQPGKTKHFQTLQLDTGITLCDCPGLVFPSFVASKAELILHGILPIDKQRDLIAPTTLLCRRIPRVQMESLYGDIFHVLQNPNKKWVTARELLGSYAIARGFLTGHQQPDNSRAARYILKDYLTGRLVYTFPPDDEIAREKVAQQMAERAHQKWKLEKELERERLLRSNNSQEVCIGWNGEGSLHGVKTHLSAEDVVNDAKASAMVKLDEQKFFDPSLLVEGDALDGFEERAVPLEISERESRRRGKGKNRMGHGRRKGRKAKRFASENPYAAGLKMDDIFLNTTDLATLDTGSGLKGRERFNKKGKSITKKQERRERKKQTRKKVHGGITLKAAF